MSSRLSAADKEQINLLAGAQATALAAMKTHQKTCAACKPGKDWHKRACPHGWELAKAVAAAAAALRDWLRSGQLAEHNGQQALW